MGFIEEIKEMENDKKSKDNMVVNEIVEYFKEKMYSDPFKDNLKRYIKKAINNGKNTCDLKIEFWEYSAGCSDTYIYVSGCEKFEIKGNNDNYDSRYNYKGIRLCDIHKRICSTLSDMLKDRIRELDLKFVSSEREDNKYRFGYYVEKITISW